MRPQAPVGKSPPMRSTTFERAVQADTSKPQHILDTMAFMFETRVVIRPTRFAMESPQLQRDYAQCWQGLRSHFNVSNP